MFLAQRSLLARCRPAGFDSPTRLSILNYLRPEDEWEVVVHGKHAPMGEVAYVRLFVLILFFVFKIYYFIFICSF
jgi:hypothetical protein